MLPAIGSMPPIIPGPIGHGPIPQYWDHGVGFCRSACCASAVVTRKRPATTTEKGSHFIVDTGLFARVTASQQACYTAAFGGGKGRKAMATGLSSANRREGPGKIHAILSAAPVATVISAPALG